MPRLGTGVAPEKGKPLRTRGRGRSPSVQVQQLGADAFQCVEGIHHLVDGGFVAACLEHNHAIIGAKLLAGFMEAHPKLDVAAKLRENLLQIQGVGVAMIHTQANDIIAIHEKAPVSVEFPRVEVIFSIP